MTTQDTTTTAFASAAFVSAFLAVPALGGTVESGDVVDDSNTRIYGDTTAGSLFVDDAASFDPLGTSVVFGRSVGSFGTGVITGSGTVLTNQNDFIVGQNGRGDVTVSAGAVVNNGTLLTETGGFTVGGDPDSRLLVTGSGTQFNNGGGSGRINQGTITVDDGALLKAFGDGPQVNPGRVLFTLAPSDASESATLNVSNGGTLDMAFMFPNPGDPAQRSRLGISDVLGAGLDGTSVVNVTSGGQIVGVERISFGSPGDAASSLNVDGAGSLVSTFDLFSADNGTTNVSLSNGGVIDAGGSVFLNTNANTNTLTGGTNGGNTISITEGSQLLIGNLFGVADGDATTTLTVEGDGALLQVGTAMEIGFGATPGGTASITVADGGEIRTPDLIASFGANDSATFNFGIGDN
ncbi:MAG: hypothetical protein AAF561_08580 [Planctomycetota bacterium]